MKVEVWKKGLFGGARKVRDGLTVFAVEGSAYASWKHGPVVVRTSLRITVGDALAHKLLGAVRLPCPHVGQTPVYGWRRKGYYCHGSSSASDDAYTLERCVVCGYSERYEGSPRFNAAMTGMPSAAVHPDRTYLRTRREGAVVTDADWDVRGKVLIPHLRDGRLIIWTGGRLTRKIWGSFPDAGVVSLQTGWTILQSPS